MGNLEKRLEALEKANTVTHPMGEVLADLAGRIDPDGWNGDEGELILRMVGENDDDLRQRVAASITGKYDLTEILGRIIARLPN